MENNLNTAFVMIVIKQLNNISENTRKELNVLLFSDLLEKMDNDEKVLRIPSVIKLLTDGGNLSTQNLIKLGKYIIKNKLWETNKIERPTQKIWLTKKMKYNINTRKVETEEIQIIKYGLEHLEILLEICDEWLKIYKPEIMYL